MHQETERNLSYVTMFTLNFQTPYHWPLPIGALKIDGLQGASLAELLVTYNWT